MLDSLNTPPRPSRKRKAPSAVQDCETVPHSSSRASTFTPRQTRGEVRIGEEDVLLPVEDLNEEMVESPDTRLGPVKSERANKRKRTLPKDKVSLVTIALHHHSPVQVASPQANVKRSRLPKVARPAEDSGAVSFRDDAVHDQLELVASRRPVGRSNRISTRISTRGTVWSEKLEGLPPSARVAPAFHSPRESVKPVPEQVHFSNGPETRSPSLPAFSSQVFAVTSVQH